MKIHILQHVSFEPPAYIADWALAKGHELSFTKFHEAFTIPFPEDIDMLIIMGGPMSVSDEDKHSWLIEEKKYLARLISKKKKVLGICLGSQLIADALGSRIYDNTEKEIGWFDIEKNKGSGNKLLGILPNKIRALHWHGQTYDLPKRCERLFSSETTSNQGFVYNNRVFAFQFHLEVSPSGLKNLIEFAGEDLTDGKYVQSPEQMCSNENLFAESKDLLFKILDYIELAEA
ncbi:MAG: type 1 glutamine amidotransferase [Chlorobi bacterium]|nr:type 1 glutamine amidotransferase [Chlorobiota bacterium]